MASIVTGTPAGNVITPDDVYLDSPPPLYFQEKFTPSGGTVGLLNDADTDGFYWGLSGTTDNPVYELGCYTGFSFADGREVNMVRCDTVGDKQAIQKRTNMIISLTLKQFFPLTQSRHSMHLGAVTSGGGIEKAGIPDIDNAKRYYAYFPSVYDQAAGDYVSVTLHNAQFVNAWSLGFQYGNAAEMPLTIMGFADETKPAAQRFGTIIRADPSLIAA